MAKDIILIACIILILHQNIAALDCNTTHFHYTSIITLGKQDELNKTFEKMQEKITSLNDVQYNATEAITYTISKVNPSFYYRDSKQQAKLATNDTIIVQGGFVEVDFTFDWEKKHLISQKGTGSAKGLSQEIIYAKALIVDNGFYAYKLLDAQNVTFSTFQLTRIDPPDSSDGDKQILNIMMNSNQGKDVRAELQQEVSKYFQQFLGNSLHDEHMPIDLQFDYKWIPTTPGKNNVTISMKRRPIDVDVEKQGIQTTFEVQVQNDTNWKCGDRSVPISPYDPIKYGGSQEFISYDYYQSVLRYAIQKNILNTDLNRQNWQSRMFQFYVGDLYEVIPILQEKYYADTALTGACQPTYDRLKIQGAQKDAFNVTIHFECSLGIPQKEKIVDFSLDLNLTVAGNPGPNSIDFKLRSHSQIVKFFPFAQFRIENDYLGERMIQSCLNRLYQGTLFGSGYPLYPARDYPQFLAQNNFTLVYDSTHVNAFKQ